MTTSERESAWARWPDPDEGPLWVGLHVHRRAGVAALVGLEVFTEPPGAARADAGPAGADWTLERLPVAPRALRAHVVRSLDLGRLLERLGGPEGLLGAGRDARRRLGADHWARVAQVALRAAARGDRATARAVAEHFGVARQTAKNWLAECRRRGLLPQPEKATSTATSQPA